MLRASPTDLILNADGSIYHLGLRPSQVPDKIIVVGDPDRVGQVSRYFQKVELKVQKREFCTHLGVFEGEATLVLSSGIGTDNVEILMTELDALVNFNLPERTVKQELRSLQIVRIGTSGAIQPEVEIGSYLVSESAVGFDNLAAFYGGEHEAAHLEFCAALQSNLNLGFTPYFVPGNASLIQKLGGKMIKGITATAPGFYAPQGRTVRAQTRYGDFMEKLSGFSYNGLKITNLEMETAGYYLMGNLLGHKVASANAILANRLEKKFDANPAQTVEGLIKHVLERF